MLNKGKPSLFGIVAGILPPLGESLSSQIILRVSASWLGETEEGRGNSGKSASGLHGLRAGANLGILICPTSQGSKKGMGRACDRRWPKTQKRTIKADSSFLRAQENSLSHAGQGQECAVSSQRMVNISNHQNSVRRNVEPCLCFC